MERTQDEAVQIPNDFANMSDEDFLNLDVSFTSEESQETAQEGGSPVSEEAEEESPETEAADQEEAVEGEEAEEDSEETGSEAEEDEPESEEESTGDSDETEETEESEESEQEEETEETPEVDYKAEYEKLLRPFKANGKELKVDNVDEAIQLMQMGANYNKKMAALKPNLKLLKLLENNNLLDQEKLSYLIDLEKKDPEAIKKLVKDSGIDPLDINTEEESEYKPKAYTVDDREIELDSVLDEIQDTPTYSKTISLVSNKWDGQSKQVIADNPQLLKVINDHMQLGIYDRVSSEIEKQGMFGRLNGLSDLEAYRLVADELHAKGAFNDLLGIQQEEPKAPARKTVVKKPKEEDPKLKSKKRAASSTRTAPSKTGPDPDFNPLAMSDEEFEKAFNEKLM